MPGRWVTPDGATRVDEVALVEPGATVAVQRLRVTRYGFHAGDARTVGELRALVPDWATLKEV